MDIQTQLDNFKSLAAERNVLVLEGDYKQNKSPIVEMPNNDKNSHEIFQKIIENLQVKIVIYETLFFSVTEFEIYDSIIEKLGDNILQEKIAGLRDFKNKRLGYTLFIFSEGITFRFEYYIDEIDKYLDVQEAVNSYTEDKEFENSEFIKLPEQKIKELGKELVEHETYAKLKIRAQRRSLAVQLFSKYIQEQKITYQEDAIVDIVAAAEFYNENVLKPKEAAYLKEKIKELLATGMRKFEIMRELDISKDKLNKYIE